MKKLISTFITIVAVLQLNAQNYHYLANFNSQGVPSNITYENVPQSLINNINASFPEGYPVPTYNPSYIADGVDTDIILKDSADVWITFVQEGAGYRNVLGYYTYTDKPSAQTPSDVTIVFPNVSAQGSGGGLKTGAKVYLGAFPAGTKIGWFLIADGFINTSNGNGKVGSGIWKFFSNPEYNPESLSSQRKHNVMLFDESSGIVAIGFEDIKRDNPSCDQDFNDALFYVKSNPIKAIETETLNKVVDAGEAGSGAGGGLESKLASKIATRLFMRNMNNEKQLDCIEKQEDFAPSNERGENLSTFVPQKVFSNSIEKVSTPKDLVEITNANDVLAVDYYQVDGGRLAAILATQTDDRVYEHTKVVCDRLVGAQLTNIEEFTIENKAFTINKLIQADRNIEYALSFSAYQEGNVWLIESQWGVDQFPKKSKFLNFQIWGANPTYVKRLAIEVIAKLRTQYTVRMAPTTISVPKVYVKSGRYNNGILKLEIQNTIKASKLTVSGNLQRTETATSSEAWKYDFALNGNKTQTIEIQLGDIFDSGILIENNVSKAVDYIYLADGVWSYGVNPEDAKVESFDVTNDIKITSEDPSVHQVERNISVKGKVKKYAAIFRTLRPSGKTMDLKSFREVSFVASGKGTFEVVLVKKSIADWNNQFRMVVQLDGTKKTIALPFSSFRSAATTQSIIADDISSVVIAAKGDNKNFSAFQFELSDLKFSKFMDSNNAQVNAYPNPASEIVNIEFRLPSASPLTLDIFDTAGRLVSSIEKNGEAGFNQLQLSVNQFIDGVYYCAINSKSTKLVTKIIVRKN